MKKKELSKAYNAKEYEDEIYKKWESSGFFNPDTCVKKGICDKNAQTFSLLMPPPNVTGVLHLGHALENALMDMMTRYQRMQGKRTLFLPGTDHAAVATQARVEKDLIESGKYKNPREELGREKLLKIIRQYADDCKKTIIKQIKKLGSSCDWSRLAYTFDEERSRAVNEMFKKMYDDGLIYRGLRAVNWSVRGQSTCSDDEIVHLERKTKLWTFRYSRDFPIAIATTRPETKLGDTAVAVNPKDKRYKKYIGKSYTVDVGAARPLEIKVIADNGVDTDFGTGALGVTPAHSQIDYEIYEKQKAKGEEISLVSVIGKNGRMNEKAGAVYQGLTVDEAREKFVEWLKKEKLLLKEEEVKQNVGTSDRFKDAIEVLPMEQWFVDVNRKIPGRGKSLKDLMREAATLGHRADPKQKVRITPERFRKNYLQWIDNLRDWCISRQIWWGHRIPVWYSTKARKHPPALLCNALRAGRNTKTNEAVEITYYVHGTTVDNEKEKASGQYNVGLSKLGVKQSEELREMTRDKKFDVVFCSDLKRAVDSAEMAFGERFKIIKDKRLRECDYGKMTRGDNKRVEEMEKKVIDKPFPDGESYKDVENRMKDFLEDLIDKYAGKKVAIVAHKAPQLALEVLLNGKSWEQAIDEDWRKKRAWQPGWKYVVNNVTMKQCNNESVEIKVQSESPGRDWVQDPDTLDTWFSSGLWTFSTLGWPDGSASSPQGKTPDLKTYHPTSWMQMGYEILFFWLARMILSSTYTLDEIPFREVYIHGMLRNKEGKKFSKSDKVGTDPLELIKEYGADALRLSLLLGISAGNDSRFYEEKIKGARNFVNKLWNVSRFILMNTDDDGLKQMITDNTDNDSSIRHQASSISDKWILSEMNKTIGQVTRALEGFQFSRAGEILQEFTWAKLADWYLEISKIESGKDEILMYILTNLLKLWHPFLPFVTEEIWGQIDDNLLMIQKWPEVDEKMIDIKAEGEFLKLQELVVKIRNMRVDKKIEPKEIAKVKIKSKKYQRMVREQRGVIEKLGRCEMVEKEELLMI